MTQISPWDRIPNSIAKEIDKNRQDRFFFIYLNSLTVIPSSIDGLINIIISCPAENRS